MARPLTYPLPVLWALLTVVTADPDANDVARARAGDELAFEQLVSRHERGVYALAWRLLGEREEALDATQETFLRVFRALPSFRGEASFRTWVIGIATNVCRTRGTSVAARAARAALPLTATDPESGEPIERPLPDPAPDPEASAHGGELRRALGRALAALTPDHREILLLAEMEGLSYEELAAALGCRLGTVRSRLARARAALRQRLSGVWP